MVKLNRGSKTLTNLSKTSRKFKKAIQGLNVRQAYDFYLKNQNHYRYNTQETKQEFKKINQGRCSFCTKHILEFDKEMTVEHIRIKRDYPKKIFVWTNLLCSCHTCNTQRGVKPFDKNKYLDPTKVEDIEKYFTYELDGEILPSYQLTEEEKEKAQYMIELYDLNRPTLKCERRKFMKDLMSNDEFYNCLKQMGNNSPNIIFLSLFTYYKGVYN